MADVTQMSFLPASDPEFLPYKLDLIGRRVLWLRVTAAQRRDAAFLDERAVQEGAEGGWMSLDSVMATTFDAGPSANAIFHIGHCGSTLLSRLLDGWSEVQGLREPLPLRTLAAAWPLLPQAQSRLSPLQAPTLLQALWARWSRPPGPATRTVIKATSTCNGLIAPLLAHVPDLRLILLCQPLRPYLATLLKAPASVLDAANAAAERLSDLQARGFVEGVALHALSLSQQCAMGWLAERVRFNALATDERVFQVDFETLLARPEVTLQAITSHLALDPAGIAAAIQAPAWTSYSKAQNYGYSREDRAHDLALAVERHREEIDAGMVWVEAMLRQYPALQTVTVE